MALYYVRDELFPAHYNHRLMDWRRREMGLSIRAIARLLKCRHTSMMEVFHGRASSKVVYPVARVLGLDWAKVHDLSLRESDYPHAVVINASKRGGTYSTAAIC